MPFEVESEPGESIILCEAFRATEKAEPFAFAVSDRALYIPAKKLFAVRDPFYFRRVPLNQVQSASLERLRPTATWVISALLVVVGLVTTYLMFEPLLAGRGGRASGYPIAIVVVGLVLPFAARGRHALVISLTSGAFKWKPMLTVGGTGRVEGLAFQKRILEACRKAGVFIRDPIDVA